MQKQEEFLRLIEENKGILHKVCSVYAPSKAEREDIFQEIIVQLWKAWPSFRGQSKFSTWMYRVALNTAIGGFRRKKTELVLMEHGQLPERWEEDEGKKEKLAAMYRAIRTLPEIDRAVVMLYLEDHSYEEMEEVLGISQGTLRVKMNRIREKLRKTIQTPSYGT